MLTLSKPSHSSQFTISSLKKSAGLSSEVFDRGNTLSPQKSNFHNRSSAAQQNGLSSLTSGRTQRAALSFSFRTLNPSAKKIAGNGTSSVENVRQMYNGGTLKFYSDKRFLFTPKGVGTIARADLFPISGTYRQASDGIRFEGRRTSSNLTSRNSAAIAGVIYRSGGQFKAAVNQRTVLTNAAYINGTPFSNTIDRTVRIDMSLVRIA